MNAAIPAPGYQTFQGRQRPHLVTEALHAVRFYGERGLVVPGPAVTVLVALCDAVEASHGQFYGSWDRLIARYPWSRSWWFKWLAQLEPASSPDEDPRPELVANLGRLPGRRTTTWQVLPHVYRLVSTDTDTSESQVRDHSTMLAVSTDEDTDSPRIRTVLVSTDTDAASVHGYGHKHLEHQENTKEKHPLTVAPIQKSTPCAWCESSSCSGSQREEHGRLRAKQLLAGVVKDIAS